MAGKVHQLDHRQLRARPGFVRRPPPSKPCGAGVTACGKPARLYPCGWRCDDHDPGRVQAAEQPDTETGTGEAGGAG